MGALASRICTEFWNIRHYNHEISDSQAVRMGERRKWKSKTPVRANIKRAGNQPEPSKDHIVNDDYILLAAGLLAAGAFAAGAFAAGAFAAGALAAGALAAGLLAAGALAAGAFAAGALAAGAFATTFVVAVLAGLLAELFAGAAPPQAIPRALRPRTVESTITFFIRTSLLSSSKLSLLESLRRPSFFSLLCPSLKRFPSKR
jgi:FtsH-binding integral membrane protein